MSDTGYYNFETAIGGQLPAIPLLSQTDMIVISKITYDALLAEQDRLKTRIGELEIELVRLRWQVPTP